MRLYARALIGQRYRGRKTQKRGRYISIISAISLEKVVASVNIYGAVDAVTFYTQTLRGTRKGNQLNLNITTKIELDTQKTQAIWTLTADSLNTGREVYQKQPCLVSQIRFAPGTNSATVNQSVVRGSRNIYLLRANQGQRMDLKITSLENNAVFDVIAPNGEILTTEATQSSLKLPATGNYEIIVGGTRGNATYKLNVKIQ